MSPAKKTLVIVASSTKETQIETDIKDRYDSKFLRFRGVPKGLLPISGRPALSWWYEYAQDRFDCVYIISNAYNFKHFERWASAVNFPRENILNSGLSSGILQDLAFVHRVKHIQNDIVITGADIIPTEAIYYNHSELFDGKRNFIRMMDENSIAFGMSFELLQGLDDYIEQVAPTADADQSSRLKLYIITKAYDASVSKLSAEDYPLLNYVDASISLQSYLDTWQFCKDDDFNNRCKSFKFQTEPLHMRAYARVGLMGNPSDGFYGKTMSLLISNFWAEVTLIPNHADDQEVEAITILPNPVSDPHKFSSLECLVGVSQIDGYETGDRLLQACCKVFYLHCKENNIPINTKQGFRMMFETNIPRQVGLAGSSAIITALWKMLSLFYGVTQEQIPLELQASLVLKVEWEELGIAAGLQDRVIQSFGGLVYMDFDREYMEKHGHGKYESLDVGLLPKLWLAYVADPDDSGKVHSAVKQRFLNGDQEIIDAMQKFASFTEQARTCLQENNHKAFAQLMSNNFNLRRETYGDAVVGASNLRMIELARQHNCAAKFPGSGGAIVGMWNGENAETEAKDLLQLRRALESEGFVFLEITPMVYGNQ
ncbi:phosphatidylinositol-binding protein scs2 [Mucor velutinosus]|uniref:Phosphatidylinositol-binding protein scs2 n=1 Tax=Mucor velutinosus TaxID=708070 RepID=A0AAN7HX54_9FUNG|nr:phosphatidylinositol-binding protein scs2 [Mucor velutinosus]